VNTPGRPRTPGRDLARVTFGVLFIGLLLGVSLWVLRPFLGPLVWATMVVVATWPLMLRVQAATGGRRWLAVTAMTLLLLLLFVVPLVMAIVTIVGNADRLIDWARLAAAWRLPEAAPDWLRTLPLLGGHVDALWAQLSAQLAALGLRDLLPRLGPYAGDLTRWFVAEVGNVGVLVLQFLLTVLLAAVMYAHGEAAARQVRLFAHRLAGERGDGAVVLAGGAIRGVALGVGGTALVQAALGGLGLVVAGVPAATLLTALMFMLCIAQIGPMPVLLGAAAWAYWGMGDGGSLGWAIALAVWALIVGTIDNVVRPLLIQLGADLPLILIFAGVIGGLFAFGLVGIFVGPVVLAVGYTLLEAWMHEREPAEAAPPEFRD
jgi:predicted PurR-regulated permease PerM